MLHHYMSVTSRGNTRELSTPRRQNEAHVLKQTVLMKIFVVVVLCCYSIFYLSRGAVVVWFKKGAIVPSCFAWMLRVLSLLSQLGTCPLHRSLYLLLGA